MLRLSGDELDVTHWRMLASGLPKQDIKDAFPTLAAAERRLATVVWPDGPRCPKCQTDDSWYIKSRNLRQCRREKCRKKQFSLRSVSPLRRSRIPLHKLFYGASSLIWALAKDDLSTQRTISQLQKVMGCSYVPARNQRLSMFADLKTDRGGFWGSLICINEMTPASYADEWYRDFIDEQDPSLLLDFG
ncbi:transposase [Sulfitobacter donghicola]|nr:transposase [Sulfitobacter donghicola]